MGQELDLDKIRQHAATLNPNDIPEQNLVLLNPQYANSYSYAGNNPLVYVDPDGNFLWKQALHGGAKIVSGVSMMIGGGSLIASGFFNAGVSAVAGVFVMAEGGIIATSGGAMVVKALYDEPMEEITLRGTVTEVLAGERAATSLEVGIDTVEFGTGLHHYDPVNIIDSGLDLLNEFYGNSFSESTTNPRIDEGGQLWQGDSRINKKNKEDE